MMHKVTTLLLLVATPMALEPAMAEASVSASRQAYDLAQEALRLYKAGQYGAAAALYRRAYELQPSTAEYLFGAARSELAAGNRQLARNHFAAVCSAVGQDHPLCTRSLRHLAEAKQPADKPKDAAGLPQAATASVGVPPPLALEERPEPIVETPVSVVGQSTPTTQLRTRRLSAWVALGFVGATALAGTVFAAGAYTDQADLDAHRLPDGRFDAGRIGYAEARSAQQTVNNQWWAAAAAAALATFSAGTSAYLFHQDLLPTPSRSPD